jgi:hypothetical protein
MLRTNFPSISFQSTPQRILTCQHPSSLALQHCVRYPQNAWAIPSSMSKGGGRYGSMIPNPGRVRSAKPRSLVRAKPWLDSCHNRRVRVLPPIPVAAPIPSSPASVATPIAGRVIVIPGAHQWRRCVGGSAGRHDNYGRSCRSRWSISSRVVVDSHTEPSPAMCHQRAARRQSSLSSDSENWRAPAGGSLDRGSGDGRTKAKSFHPAPPPTIETSHLMDLP